jgi:hypothetical protein
LAGGAAAGGAAVGGAAVGGASAATAVHSGAAAMKSMSPNVRYRRNSRDFNDLALNTKVILPRLRRTRV